MQTQRAVTTTIKSVKVNMDGFLVDQPLPHPTLTQVDPFILIHHAKTTYPPGSSEKTLGVGPHPHRGFSPVTLVFDGSVHHRDSRGNDSIVLAGGTQWMNAGRGIIHSERPGKKSAEEGGSMEIIQFWVNSPAKEKMSDPQYHALSLEETPVVPLVKGKGKARIVSGAMQGVTGPVIANSDLLVVRFELSKGDTATIPITDRFNALLYNLDGSLLINKTEEIGNKTMVVFEKNGTHLSVEALSDARFILLAGKPLEEHVVSYGPFVMNTDQEIWEAMRDYRMGKMGYLVEEFTP